MNTDFFNYNLPLECIAQHSVEPRDHSKLMVIERKEMFWRHHHFYDIVHELQPGDVIVWNNSKVFKARLQGKLMSQNNEELWEHKRDIELFLVRPKENEGVWQVLVKGSKHVQNGMRIEMANDFFCDVMVKKKDGTLLVQFEQDEDGVRAKANKYGSIPIPPYVKNEPDQLELYQTRYAKHEGSVAAPTAGFHFTDELIEKLKSMGVIFAEVTLHVGLGTFLPVKSEHIEDHTMHSEWAELTQENADIINTAKKEGRRVITVGTTATRTLEGIAALPLFKNNGNELPAFTGDIDLFITPGFEFKIVEGLITNFHLPKSTLLMLVSAFVGDREFVIDAYKEAIEQHYRFYSFGDAMLII